MKMINGDTSNRKPLPTLEEVDAMVAAEFPEPNAQCNFLCEEFQNASDALDNPDLTAAQRKKILARMGAYSTQMRALHCPMCLLQ
jgi:hypothetical protein